MKKNRLIRFPGLLKRFRKNLMFIKCCIVFIFGSCFFSKQAGDFRLERGFCGEICRCRETTNRYENDV